MLRITGGCNPVYSAYGAGCILASYGTFENGLKACLKNEI